MSSWWNGNGKLLAWLEGYTTWCKTKKYDYIETVETYWNLHNKTSNANDNNISLVKIFSKKSLPGRFRIETNNKHSLIFGRKHNLREQFDKYKPLSYIILILWIKETLFIRSQTKNILLFLHQTLRDRVVGCDHKKLTNQRFSINTQNSS